MSVEIDDKSIDSLIAKYAKLNELKDQQLDTVKELLKDGIDQGILIGEIAGAANTAEAYDKITQKLVLARTFTASMTAVVLIYPFVLLTTSIPLVILGTALANTIAFYSIDLIAMGLRKLYTKLSKKS